MRILIVEDEPLISLHLETVVTEAGHEVADRAATGLDAVRAAQRTRPDLVLMDIGLAGDMDGVAAAREIFRRWQVRSLFVSAISDRYKDTAADTRPLGFLTKPVAPRQLLEAIEAAAKELRSG